GMGRTGKWFAIEQFAVEPDIVCVGKGIASGVPLGAMIARKSLISWTKGTHGNTFGGNPIACAAALATIDLLEDKFMFNAAEVGAYSLDALEELKLSHMSIGDVRGMGLMIGIEFVKDRESREPDVELRDQIIHLAFERGLLLLGCGKSSLRIAPALSITKGEIDEGLKILDEAITFAEEKQKMTHVA
ncbi:MAG: aminotransferase class III-fold pyridoxal phosphate-dependent enzyme, partial [Chloroflexota bacterium]